LACDLPPEDAGDALDLGPDLGQMHLEAGPGHLRVWQVKDYQLTSPQPDGSLKVKKSLKMVRMPKNMNLFEGDEAAAISVHQEQASTMTDWARAGGQHRWKKGWKTLQRQPISRQPDGRPWRVRPVEGATDYLHEVVP